MSDLFVGFLLLFVPLAAICGAFAVSAKGAKSPTVAKMLRGSALVWFILLGVVFAVFLLAGASCSGNYLYGFRECAVLPDSVANFSVPATLLGILSGGVYAVGLMIVTTVMECRFRNARDSDGAA